MYYIKKLQEDKTVTMHRCIKLATVEAQMRAEATLDDYVVVNEKGDVLVVVYFRMHEPERTPAVISRGVFQITIGAFMFSALLFSAILFKLVTGITP